MASTIVDFLPAAVNLPAQAIAMFFVGSHTEQDTRILTADQELGTLPSISKNLPWRKPVSTDQFKELIATLKDIDGRLSSVEGRLGTLEAESRVVRANIGLLDKKIEAQADLATVRHGKVMEAVNGHRS